MMYWDVAPVLRDVGEGRVGGVGLDAAMRYSLTAGLKSTGVVLLCCVTYHVVFFLVAKRGFLWHH